MMRNGSCGLLCGLVVFAAGCGGPNLATVSGKITLDGKPLADATVGFYPLGSNAEVMSSGRTNASGEYTLKTVMSNQAGAVVGQHRVSVSVEPDLVGSDLAADKVGKVPRPPKIPARYQGTASELTCAVPSAGKADANFDLKSK